MNSTAPQPKSHNSPNAQPTRVSMELEDKIMAAFPVCVRRWFQEDANSDMDVAETFKVWHAIRHDDNAEDKIMEMLHSVRRIETRDQYGWGHPQAFLKAA